MEKKKILIADDEERIVKLVSDFLNASGYETVCAADGKEALDIFNADNTIDLAIIDIMMPEIDGWEITREIRKKSDMPIIMLSARAEEFDLLTGKMTAYTEGVKIDRAQAFKGSQRARQVYGELLAAAEALLTLVRSRKGCPNKDNAKLTDQIRSLIEKWK